MNQAPIPAVVAVIPCNDLDGAEAWWSRLGFSRSSDRTYDGYRILSDDAGLHVHLTEAVAGWVVPGRNPFGVYVYTPRVEACAALMVDAIIGPSRRPEHKPWGMYEIALNGPDDLLVRMGWPSHLLSRDTVEQP
ncbi:glyoxalase [Methylobacterium sp. M6A4_1b]